MAGEYTAYLGSHAAAAAAGGSSGGGCTPADFGAGPVGLWRWVVDWGGCYTFEASFLVLWGAK